MISADVRIEPGRKNAEKENSETEEGRNRRRTNRLKNKGEVNKRRNRGIKRNAGKV